MNIDFESDTVKNNLLLLANDNNHINCNTNNNDPLNDSSFNDYFFNSNHMTTSNGFNNIIIKENELFDNGFDDEGSSPDDDDDDEIVDDIVLFDIDQENVQPRIVPDKENDMLVHTQPVYLIDPIAFKLDHANSNYFYSSANPNEENDLDNIDNISFGNTDVNDYPFEDGLPQDQDQDQDQIQLSLQKQIKPQDAEDYFNINYIPRVLPNQYFIQENYQMTTTTTTRQKAGAAPKRETIRERKQHSSNIVNKNTNLLPLTTTYKKQLKTINLVKSNIIEKSQFIKLLYSKLSRYTTANIITNSASNEHQEYLDKVRFQEISYKFSKTYY
ncbi:hypothetical protein TBLA_0I00750 [Henningerozyma blattae CBS 6284]|uniref:Uncharacterized protein n=1 Tax=Henningerozyma blattae (strain ATCC 34711 / CBS 6284 / DSM 70876 / NBRC 10599 / NRRL Y-10934 / UCD 77-7) TaxID=1071380 RepID=I2H8N1_HENB6|nr:hypothetical protein TBLA_0I00750 [Tetrapisispora blattae CBS 6284]CCH62733.1 hypothetical protein TBLA_0I00750 [Tetrapisispora blattae CBS 6284]